MRIISGKYRGRKLFCQEGKGTRPTTDRVKEALFGAIQFDVPNAKVLDLFAGTGALGIEALSRGASSCDFVENDRNALAVLYKNLEKIDPDFSVYENDFNIALVRLKEEKYDLIFIDPPYDAGFYNKVMKTIFDNDMLENDGIIVIEIETGAKIDIEDSYKLKKEKKYGKTTLQYYIKGN